MADSTSKAVLQITVDAQQFQSAMDQVRNQSKKTGDDIASISSKVSQGFALQVVKEFGKALMAVGKAVGAVAGEVVELAQRGSEVQAMERSFDSLSASVGETASTMMSSLRTATTGLVGDFDLMAASNKAILLGLPVTSESMGTMAKAATVLGRAMGQDAKKSLDDLTTALGRGSPLILDNLGLTVKVSEANEAYARQLGKTAESLTEGEKKMAFYNAAMTAAKAKVAELGEPTLSLGDRIQQAVVWFNNFKDSLAVAIANSPALAAGFKAIQDALTKAFGGNTKSLVDTIVGLVVKLAILLVDVARVAVHFATVTAQAWEGVKAGFNEFFQSLFNDLGKANGFIASFVEKLTKVPGIGPGFVALASSFRQASDMANSLAYGFGELKDKAEANKKAAGDMGAAVQEGLAQVRSALSETAPVAAATAETVAKVREALPKEEDAGATGAALAAINASFAKLQADIAAARTSGLAQKKAQLDADLAADIARISNLKEITAQQKADQIKLAQDKHAVLTQLAVAAGDQELVRLQQLQLDRQLLEQTGLQASLTTIEARKVAEIAAIQTLAITNKALYDQMLAEITAKYQLMTQQAQGHGFTVEQLAAQAGFKTRAELQATADKARETYQRMLQDGTFTYAELLKAKEAAKEAEMKLDDTAAKASQILNSQTVNAVVQGLQMLAGKSKAAAIAAVIINTAQAVMKTWANLGFPAAIPGVALAVAAGAVQLAKIKSQDSGHRTGTPGLDFKNFGSETRTTLHGQEAVIPRGKGHVLAGEIASAMPGGGSALDSATLSRIAEGIDNLPATMKRAFRDGLLLAQA